APLSVPARSVTSASGSVLTGPTRSRSASSARPTSPRASVIAMTPAPRTAASSASSAVSTSGTRPNRTRRLAVTSHPGSGSAKPSLVGQPARTSRRSTAVASAADASMYRGAGGSLTRTGRSPSRQLLQGQGRRFGAGTRPELTHAGPDVGLDRLGGDA